jgi:exopolysaccharide production protein ExoQ
VPPPVAAVVFLAFVAYLFHREFKLNPQDRISWAPLIWIFLAGSRYVSSWLSMRGPGGVTGYAEGSPVDRAVFFALIAWGLVVLLRRTVDWGALFARNKVLVVYFLFCLSSVLWSDEPVILIKRWVKDLGNPIMALVMLTERRPYAAIGATLRRFSYICIPISVLFVRYYPEMGRGYKASGAPMYTGIGQQKNSLGMICLIGGLYFAWRWLYPAKDESRWKPGYPDLFLLIMVGWLLHMSDSQTSTMCLALGLFILLMAKLPALAQNPSRVVPTIAATLAAFAVLEASFGLKEQIFQMIGRDASLTNRDSLWEVVLAHEVNPWVGAGFMSFWAGDRMASIWMRIGAGVNQAHNGYLEQYMNLGYVGVAFIVAIMVAAMRNVHAHLSSVAPPAAMFRFALIAAAAMYGYTEAAFYGINPMWVLLLVACIDTAGCPPPVSATHRLRARTRARERTSALIGGTPIRPSTLRGAAGAQSILAGVRDTACRRASPIHY